MTFQWKDGDGDKKRSSQNADGYRCKIWGPGVDFLIFGREPQI